MQTGVPCDRWVFYYCTLQLVALYFQEKILQYTRAGVAKRYCKGHTRITLTVSFEPWDSVPTTQLDCFGEAQQFSWDWFSLCVVDRTGHTWCDIDGRASYGSVVMSLLRRRLFPQSAYSAARSLQTRAVKCSVALCDRKARQKSTGRISRSVATTSLNNLRTMTTLSRQRRKTRNVSWWPFKDCRPSEIFIVKRIT